MERNEDQQRLDFMPRRIASDGLTMRLINGKEVGGMKKKILSWGLMFPLMFLAACSGKTAERMMPLREETAPNTESESGGSSGIPIRIYYSDNSADPLSVSVERTAEITPEILLLNLSLYEMVPDTVTVRSFEQKKRGDGLLLTLDLSEDFGEYLSSLDVSREEEVLGSLVNTFLDAYKGTEIVITVKGGALLTSHENYSQALERYPYEEASYQVTARELRREGIAISYPEITGFSEEEIQKRWNTTIEDHARTALEHAEEGSSLKVSYEVKTMNDQLLSILIEGTYQEKDAPDSYLFRYSYNIDVKSGESVRLAYHQDVEQLAEKLLAGTEYTVEGELGEELQERLFILYGDAEQLADTLRNFDYGENRESPSGFSYQEDGKVHLCIAVPHALGDYADIVLE